MENKKNSDSEKKGGFPYVSCGAFLGIIGIVSLIFGIGYFEAALYVIAMVPVLAVAFGLSYSVISLIRFAITGESMEDDFPDVHEPPYF